MTKTDAASIEALADPVREFVDDYEFLGDNGNAVPLTDDHRALIEDAIHSFLATEPRADQRAVAELREAVRGIADDYMTSEKHHPGYVLIPAAKFDQLRAADALLPAHDAAPRQGEAEPYRWLWISPSATVEILSKSCMSEERRKRGWTEETLFRHPPAPAPSRASEELRFRISEWGVPRETVGDIIIAGDKLAEAAKAAATALDAQAVQSASEAEARADEREDEREACIEIVRNLTTEVVGADIAFAIRARAAPPSPLTEEA